MCDERTDQGNPALAQGPETRWLAVLRSSPARSAGVSYSPGDTAGNRLPAVVLLHPSRGRASGTGPPDRVASPRFAAGRDSGVLQLERTKGRHFAPPSGCAPRSDAVVAGV